MKKASSISNALYGSTGRHSGKQTRRQQKHDLLLTFMAEAKQPRSATRKRRPALLSALLSIFF